MLQIVRPSSPPCNALLSLVNEPKPQSPSELLRVLAGNPIAAPVPEFRRRLYFRSEGGRAAAETAGSPLATTFPSRRRPSTQAAGFEPILRRVPGEIHRNRRTTIGDITFPVSPEKAPPANRSEQPLTRSHISPGETTKGTDVYPRSSRGDRPQ